jgi:hypothetical protein
MTARILLTALLLCAVVGMWRTSRTWDQIVAALIGTAAWIILVVTFILEAMR